MRQARDVLCVAIGAAMVLATMAAPAAALEIKRSVLKNGAVLLVSPQHQLPMVTMEIAFDAGSRRDPEGKAGLAALTASCLTLGTKELSAAEFNQRVDFMGSSVSVSAGPDYAEAGFTSLKKYEGQTLHLLAAALTAPALRDSEITRKRDERVAAIKANEEQPGYVAGVAFRKALFGDTPYGHPSEGTAESVARLTAADVREFYRSHYKMGGAVIAVVGDVEPDEIKAKLENEFAALSGSVAPQPEPTAPAVPQGIHSTLINRNIVQATLILGAGGIARSNPDFYRIQVMNYILGAGGFASRLMKVVRSKAGLAYGISSSFETGKFPGSFTVVTQTKNRSSNEALRLILAQLREIQEHPVSDAELASAKKYLIGSFPLKIDRQSAIASFMLQVELYGLGLDYADRYPKLIEGVTKADVQRVAQKYLHPDAMLLVAVANQAEAKIDVAALQKLASGGAPPGSAPAQAPAPAAKSAAGG
ncbi:MAG TPA: pitrilysin family protein [Candidatus Binataceae bacterium]|jgi:zinc protease|nr:pitrilysin family protein [Candidatus Binataceae bacterium]